jgi:hypothetical protein
LFSRLMTLALCLGAAIAHAGTLIHGFGSGNDGGWTVATVAGAPWTFTGAAWKTGPAASNYSNSSRITLTSAVYTATGGVVSLQLEHGGSAETVFDGGVVEVSVNAGGFSYLPNSSFTSGGYNATGSVDGTAVTFLGTPGGSNVMFSGTIPTTSNADLTASLTPGDTLQFQFKFASDPSVSASGWHIDAFALTNVVAPSSDVPEPATLSLIGIAGLGLLAFRRLKA